MSAAIRKPLRTGNAGAGIAALTDEVRLVGVIEDASYAMGATSGRMTGLGRGFGAAEEPAYRDPREESGVRG